MQGPRGSWAWFVMGANTQKGPGQTIGVPSPLRSCVLRHFLYHEGVAVAVSAD